MREEIWIRAEAGEEGERLFLGDEQPGTPEPCFQGRPIRERDAKQPK